MDINKEKLKSINYFLRHYELFPDGSMGDEKWLVDHIKAIVAADEWECHQHHEEAAQMHEKQLVVIRGLEGDKFISPLYKKD